MNMPTMKFKMPQEHLELGVVIEQGFAIGAGDEDGEDAVVVVGLHDAAIRPEKRELLAGLELGLDYGFEVAHDDAPLCEVPVRVYKVLLCLRLRQRPASIKALVLEAQGFHPGFVKREASDKEPPNRKDDGLEERLVREDARCEKEASYEGDEVFHDGSFN